MKSYNIDDLAQMMSERADFDLDPKIARKFIKSSWGKILNIVSQSKGKIFTKRADVQQFYKDIPLEALKKQLMDLNEVEKVRNRIRIY